MQLLMAWSLASVEASLRAVFRQVLGCVRVLRLLLGLELAGVVGRFAVILERHTEAAAAVLRS